MAGRYGSVAELSASLGRFSWNRQGMERSAQRKAFSHSSVVYAFVSHKQPAL